jgi:hypothetical protein
MKLNETGGSGGTVRILRGDDRPRKEEIRSVWIEAGK